MTSSSLIQQYIAKNELLKKLSWFWTIALLALFVATNLYSVKLRKKIRTEQARLSRTDASIEADKKLLASYEQQLDAARKSATILGVALVQVAPSPEKQTIAFKQAASTVPDVTVVSFQVAYKQQIPEAKLVAARLRQLGYEVPPDQAIEIRAPPRISKQSYLRYFHESDKALATRILDQITATGVHATLFDLSGASDVGVAPPRQFEFRLGSEEVPSLPQKDLHTELQEVADALYIDDNEFCRANSDITGHWFKSLDGRPPPHVITPELVTMVLKADPHRIANYKSSWLPRIEAVRPAVQSQLHMSPDEILKDNRLFEALNHAAMAPSLPPTDFVQLDKPELGKFEAIRHYLLDLAVRLSPSH